MKYYRNIVFVLAIAFAVLAQLANPTLVRADGEPPTLPIEVATEEAPPELPVATEVPAEDAPIADPVEAASTSAPAEEATITEIMQEIPAGTDIVVLDESGDVLPLASAEAAEVMLVSDPMWCPSSATMVTADCVSDLEIGTVGSGELLDKIIAKISDLGSSVDGTIYFTPSYTTNDVTFDGSSASVNFEGSALTLQGGWNGTTDLDSIITYSGSSVFSVPILITNWTGAVTVNNITVNNAAGIGLNVKTKKDINLKDVTVTDSTGRGAKLDNCYWEATTYPDGHCSGRGVVTLTGTNFFKRNANEGLYVWASGNISLSNVTASGNGGEGADLHNEPGYFDVTLSGVNTFEDNGGNGLMVYAHGSFSSNTIHANRNRGGDGGVYIYGTTGAVTIGGTGNQFNDNYMTGLKITNVYDAVSLENISANGNQNGDGVYLDNTTGYSTDTVTLNGTNTFTGNHNSGLYILSDANIIVSNLTASSNVTGYGVYLNNTTSTTNKTVTLNGSNTFTGNGNSGLYVLSDGNITANNVTANSSTNGRGVDLNNTSGAGTVSLTGTNVFNSNYRHGLYVRSYGTITLGDITAGGSVDDTGIDLDNRTATHPDVILNGTYVLNNNYSDGLYAFSSGNVTINNITASGNRLFRGAYIDIRSGTGNVSLTGNNFFNGNYDAGLVIGSNADILLNTITANSNGRDGVYLITTGSVTISDSAFSGNQVSHYSGLAIFNASNVTIANSTFEDNNYGAYFKNIGDVSIADSIFSQNRDTGLYVDSNGNVTLNNITANENLNAGVFTKTTDGKTITINTITANNNCTGLHTVGSNDVHVSAKSITGNGIGFLAENSSNSYYLKDEENVTGNTVNITGYGAQCGTGTPGRQVTNLYIDPENSSDSTSDTTTTTTTTAPVVIQVTTTEPEAEFTLNCVSQEFYPVNLPNGDQVQIVCPVSGKAHISRMDSTTLPADLPAGYTYSAAFSLDIFQKGEQISYISEGGHIRASFHIPSPQAGDAYSVLYWDNDNDKWIPLKDFMLDENGKARKFNLHTDDPRVILSGLNFDFTGDSPRAEISTNFPGIFVLAQR